MGPAPSIASAPLHPSLPAQCQPYAHPRLRRNACWCRFHGALIDSLLSPCRSSGKQVIFSNYPGWKESPLAWRGCRGRGRDVAAWGHRQPASARPSLRPHPSTAGTVHPRCPSRGCPGHGSREGQMLAPLTSTSGQRQSCPAPSLSSPSPPHPRLLWEPWEDRPQPCWPAGRDQ